MYLSIKSYYIYIYLFYLCLRLTLLRGFDEAVAKIFERPLLPLQSPQKAVLLQVVVKHVFAINAAAANFTCEFEALHLLISL